MKSLVCAHHWSKTEHTLWWIICFDPWNALEVFFNLKLEDVTCCIKWIGYLIRFYLNARIKKFYKSFGDDVRCKCYCWDLPSMKNVICCDVCVCRGEPDSDSVCMKCKYRASIMSRQRMKNSNPAPSVILINFELWMNSILMCGKHKFICSLLCSGGYLIFCIVCH